jgi:hypothetical protein
MAPSIADLFPRQPCNKQFMSIKLLKKDMKTVATIIIIIIIIILVAVIIIARFISYKDAAYH